MNDSVIAPPKPPWWRRHPVRAAGAALLVLVLVAAAVAAIYRQAGYCGSPSDLFAYPRVSVAEEDRTTADECVGVTDSFRFRPGFATVMAALKKENAYAVAGGDYVTIALAGPLTLDEPRMLHRIEGAVVGVHDANRARMVGHTPRIRLVLANMDSAESSWRPVTEKLIDMSRGADHLVAVAGIGLSQDETVSSVKMLSEARIPVIGDMLTADTITNGNGISDLFRIAATTGDQVRRLGGFFRPKWQDWRAIIVAYSKMNDLYTRALTDEFKRYLGVPWMRGGARVYGFGENPGNEFGLIAGNMCSSAKINTIFYAGRAHDLSPFIDYLSNRSCHPAPITVITTSDTSRLAADDPENADAREVLSGDKGYPVTLIYTPLAEPSLLVPRSGRPCGTCETCKPKDRNQFTEFRCRFKQEGFDPADLDTGWGITEHDAVLAAARGIRLASGNSDVLPSPKRVLENLRLVQSSTYAVPGAEGPVMFRDNGDQRLLGTIPVLRFDPSGAPVRLDRPSS